MSKIDDKDRFYYNRDFLGSTSGRSLRILLRAKSLMPTWKTFTKREAASDSTIQG